MLRYILLFSFFVFSASAMSGEVTVTTDYFNGFGKNDNDKIPPKVNYVEDNSGTDGSSSKVADLSLDSPGSICTSKILWLCVSSSINYGTVGVSLKQQLSIACGEDKVNSKENSCVRVY